MNQKKESFRNRIKNHQFLLVKSCGVKRPTQQPVGSAPSWWYSFGCGALDDASHKKSNNNRIKTGRQRSSHGIDGTLPDSIHGVFGYSLTQIIKYN